MPEAEPKSMGKTKTADGGGHKLARELRRGDASDAKCGPQGDAIWNADAKEGVLSPRGRGRKLSSLAKETTSPRTTELAFASLPSPSAESGRLAPLDVGPRSPRQSAQRPSLRSTSPSCLDHPPKRATISLPTSGSCTPRSVSPRLPPMKTALLSSPSSLDDDSSLPGLGSTPRAGSRSGGQSARRVRSLPPNPKRASYSEPSRVDLVRPEPLSNGGSGLESRFSQVLGAKGNGSPTRGSNALAVVRAGSSPPRHGDGTSGGEFAAGRGTAEVAEEKRAPNDDRQPHRLQGAKPTSPPRERGEGRRLSSERVAGTSSPSSPPSPTSERADRYGKSTEEEVVTPSAFGGIRHDGISNNRGGEEIDGTNGHLLHRRNEGKHGGSMPNDASLRKGGESSTSPRTRRMRPQRDST